MASAKSCKTCIHLAPIKGEKVTGFCRRYPPQVTATNSSSFPPVRLKDFWCGEHKAKPTA